MKILIIFFMSLFLTSAFAKDLGKMGHSFEIKEESFLEMVQRKLKQLDIDEQRKKMENIARKRVEEPKPVDAIVKAKENRSFTYDPTYVLERDIELPNGEIVHKKGTRINPLDHMDFDRELYFINSNDKQQVDWVKGALKKETKNEKRIILIEGRIFDLEEDLKQEIYFDQFGELTKKFGIKAVPAIVFQEGKFLRIQEIKIR